MTTTAAQGDPPTPPLLGPVLGTLPDLVFHQEVLRRLGPTDLASLAGVGRGCAAALAATALMQWAKHVKVMNTGYFGSFYRAPLCLKEARSYAARFGNREVLEWLHSTGCPWNAETACEAAGGGHSEEVKWLHNHGCPWDSASVCAYAARSGHLRVLQWAREHHYPWDSLTLANAAYGGHLAVLQWAREHGCPWDSRTCEYAAREGHLEVLPWMREHDAAGQAWDEDRVRRYAGGPRQQEVPTWLDEIRAP
jgi:hypothetical protein